MIQYTAHLTEQNGSATRTGTFQIEVPDGTSAADAATLARARLAALGDDLDVTWSEWKDDSVSRITLDRVTEVLPQKTPAWATRDGAMSDIDSLYGWSREHYGPPLRASDSEVIRIAADQRAWDAQGTGRPYPHQTLD